MSSLLTQVVRRQALTMVPRRHESAMYISGPPMVKVTSKVLISKSFRSSDYSCFFLGEINWLSSLFRCAYALSNIYHVTFTKIQWFESYLGKEQKISFRQEII